jgi:hypothetical protein
VLEARGINQVLAWDITLVPGPVKGQHYYLQGTSKNQNDS